MLKEIMKIPVLLQVEVVLILILMEHAQRDNKANNAKRVQAS